MEKVNISKKWLLCCFFWGLFLIGIGCATSGRFERVDLTLPMRVPYIRFDYVMHVQYALIVFFCVIALVLHSLQGHYVNRCDQLFRFFLWGRMGLAILQITILLLSGKTERIQWGNYVFWGIETLLYYTLSIFWGTKTEKKFLKYSKMISIIVSIEVIWQAIVGVLPYVSYTNTYYKACLNIPLGGSNLLATYILPALVAAMFERKKKLIDYLVYAICTTGIILTKSRTAMLILIITVVIVLCKSITARNRASVMSVGVIIGIGIIGLGIIIEKYSQEILDVLYGYSSVLQGTSFINQITSGRVEQMGGFLLELFDGPLIGIGPNYSNSRGHNLFLDTLYQTGVIGLLLLVLALMNILKNKNTDTSALFSRNIVIIMVINAMFEISVFTSLLSDVLFFSAIQIASRKKCVITMERI